MHSATSAVAFSEASTRVGAWLRAVSIAGDTQPASKARLMTPISIRIGYPLDKGQYDITQPVPTGG